MQGLKLTIILGFVVMVVAENLCLEQLHPLLDVLVREHDVPLHQQDELRFLVAPHLLAHISFEGLSLFGRLGGQHLLLELALQICVSVRGLQLSFSNFL